MMMLYLRVIPEGEVKSMDLIYQTSKCEAFRALICPGVCEEPA
jgi:hypothetical protein